MKYSQKCICSQEHTIIQTDYGVIQTKMATAIFLHTTLRAKWKQTVRYNGCRAKTNPAFSTTAFARPRTITSCMRRSLFWS